MNELWMHILIAAIAGVPGLLVAAATLIKVLRNTKSIMEVHVAINSRMDNLLKITANAAEAKGHLQGVRDGIAKAAEPKPYSP